MAAGLSRSTPFGWLQESDLVSRSTPFGWETEVTPTGGAITISMGIGTAAWTGVNFTFDASVWPLPAQVQSGVVYGPNGNDLTGTLASGGSGVPRSRITNA
jgi:hypothetical protein